MIYIISDTHFNHQKMIDTGFRPVGYEDKILDSLRQLKSDDLLIHLGDFCMGKDELAMDKMMLTTGATKILVRGNHDHKSNSWYLSQGFDFVCETFKDTYYGKRIEFMHIPKPLSPDCDLQIHGHWHAKTHRNEEIAASTPWYTDRHRLVSLELQGYKAFPLEAFIAGKFPYKTPVSTSF